MRADMTPTTGTTANDRAYRSLWILTLVTVLAAGMLAQALAAQAGPVADLLAAGSALLLATSGTLLARVLRHLTQRPR